MAQLPFEFLKHKLNSALYNVPILMDENRNPSHHPVAETLLRMAEVIAPQLEPDADPRIDLANLQDRTGVLIVPSAAELNVGSDGDAIVIEEAKGAGSVIVRKAATEINLSDRPAREVPTEAFFEMIAFWNQHRLQSIVQPPK
jgi:hypothetical protein